MYELLNFREPVCKTKVKKRVFFLVGTKYMQIPVKYRYRYREDCGTTKKVIVRRHTIKMILQYFLFVF